MILAGKNNFNVVGREADFEMSTISFDLCWCKRVHKVAAEEVTNTSLIIWERN